jgi:uncharacterized circularly permuted ATP-grasp superfamily protein/uncharacterized alpha-E superfamily protein
MPKQLLESYPAADWRYDELLAGANQPRPHWQRVFASLAGSTQQQMRDRIASVDRQVRENGVTYNVYADTKGLARPWELDPLPMLIPNDDWAAIEAGIAQRATLLNHILADLYGEQRLLREGLIPPALVFGHSGFLRPVHGMKVPGDVHLHLYAADLARSPDGKWWVIADRTQAPSGAGYALENRLIVSRVFPELFREEPVQRLANFFATLRDSLARLAPHGAGPSLTVLLTPGPYNETYFEHSFLARYLGFPLVQGGDLTVREGCVWLKTIEGLRRVHAILRRQDDDFCDPVELRSDSALGIPGLADCARRGSVLIANALGSGVLESGSLFGFLPRLAETLLGAPLAMPSVATWWCGEAPALEDALAKIDRLVFKSASPAYPFEPVFADGLGKQERAAFEARLRAHPERFVAQELVRLSQAPVLDRSHGRRLEARAVGLRVYAVATEGGYMVMPGGLTRTAGSHDARVISMQRGGGSKDTWVLSAGPVNTSFSLLRTTLSGKDIVRAPAGLPSRVAENLFWFGRYAERCDNAARLLRVALNRAVLDVDDDDDTKPLAALAKDFGLLQDDVPLESALLAAATRPDQPFGLAANLLQLARVAFNVRDRLSLDNWRTINRLTQDNAFGREVTISGALNWLDRAINGLMTLSGFALDGMTRDTGWRFLSLGRRIERLAFVSLAISTACRDGRGSGVAWLLEVADSIITYRSRYLSRPEWLPALDLLMQDDANPRSLAFQAKGIVDYLERLEVMFGPCGRELLVAPLAALRSLDPDRDLRPESARLERTLLSLRAGALDLSDRLSLRFFSHTDAPHIVTLAA